MEIVINVIVSLWFFLKSMSKSLFKKSKIGFKKIKSKTKKLLQTLKIVLITIWVLTAFIIIENTKTTED